MEVPDFIKGFGTTSPETWQDAKLIQYKPKKFLDNDVLVEVEYCGVCSSDYHNVAAKWTPYSGDCIVPGHEIVGKVVKIGKNVKSLKVGDIAGVGPSSDCCGICVDCKAGNENYCRKNVLTYNGINHSADNYVTKGGFASHVIATEIFVFPVPELLPKAYAAPLMCAGLTVFAPLRRHLGADATGKTVGIIGIGGLGHLAVQFAKALGATVVAFSRSSSKKEDSFKFGADDFVATGESDDWNKLLDRKFDLVLNCASGFSGINYPLFLSTIKPFGQFVNVGAPDEDEQLEIPSMVHLFSGTSLTGSISGNREDAIEMLQLAAEKKVYPLIEKLPINQANVNQVIERVRKSDVKYRFVLTDYDKCFH